jgi:hypothetical protein
MDTQPRVGYSVSIDDGHDGLVRVTVRSVHPRVDESIGFDVGSARREGLHAIRVVLENYGQARFDPGTSTAEIRTSSGRWVEADALIDEIGAGAEVEGVLVFFLRRDESPRMLRYRVAGGGDGEWRLA